jgi:hypothetical protein
MITEIAYGHHRLAALKEEYGDEYEIEITIQELSNAEMFRMMADENADEWVTNVALHNIETVRAAPAA